MNNSVRTRGVTDFVRQFQKSRWDGTEDEMGVYSCLAAHLLEYSFFVLNLTGTCYTDANEFKSNLPIYRKFDFLSQVRFSRNGCHSRYPLFAN